MCSVEPPAEGGDMQATSKQLPLIAMLVSRLKRCRVLWGI